MREHLIRMPAIGDGIVEAELAEWLVAEGDEVELDDLICAVMTDKATIEIPSPHAGRVLWLGAGPGDMIEIGADLIRLAEGPALQAQVDVAGADTPPPAPPPQADGDGAARRRPAALSRPLPPICITEEIELTAAEDLCETLNARSSRDRLTIPALLVRALVRALREQPDLNAHFDGVAGTTRQLSDIHVGVSMPEGGLVLAHAGAMSLWDTAAALARPAGAARAQAEPTVRIMWPGGLAALAAIPVLRGPEVAAVCLNRVVTRPVWDGQGFVPRRVMILSGVFEAHAVDEWAAAVFATRLRQLLENPALIFVES